MLSHNFLDGMVMDKSTNKKVTNPDDTLLNYCAYDAFCMQQERRQQQQQRLIMHYKLYLYEWLARRLADGKRRRLCYTTMHKLRDSGLYTPWAPRVATFVVVPSRCVVFLAVDDEQTCNRASRKRIENEINSSLPEEDRGGLGIAFCCCCWLARPARRTKYIQSAADDVCPNNYSDCPHRSAAQNQCFETITIIIVLQISATHTSTIIFSAFAKKYSAKWLKLMFSYAHVNIIVELYSDMFMIRMIAQRETERTNFAGSSNMNDRQQKQLPHCFKLQAKKNTD